MTGRDETDQERLTRLVDDLDKRAVHRVMLTLVMLVAGAAGTLRVTA
jgi:hypothetical protein